MPSIDDLIKNGVNTYSYYQPEEKPPEDGNAVRGFKRAMYQIPETLGGTAALVGDVVGSDGLRDYGMGIYEKNHAKSEALTKPSDSLTSVLQGEDGANVGDFLAGSAGYVAGQAVTALATGGAGGFIGSQLAKRGIRSVVEKGIESTAAKMAAEKAIETGAKRGAGAALFGSNLSQEAGSIYPEALEQAKKEGRDLDGWDKARVAAAAFGAAGVETAADALMLKGILKGGRKAGEGMGRAALREVPGAMGREAATEGVQTGIERYGAGQDLTTAEAIRDYVDSMGVGAVGGGLGGGASVLHAQKVPESGPLTHAANTAVDSGAADASKPLDYEKVDIPKVNGKELDLSLTNPNDIEYISSGTPDLQKMQQRVLERRNQGEDFTIVEHDNGGYRMVPTGSIPKAAVNAVKSLQPKDDYTSSSPEASTANIKKLSDKYDPFTLDHAQNIIASPGAKEHDLMIAPHASGKGYTVVPSKWLSLEDQAKSIALQKGDEGRLPGPDREAPSGRIRVDSEGGAAKETYGDQSRTAAVVKQAKDEADAAAARREELGTPVPYGTKVSTKPGGENASGNPDTTQNDAGNAANEGSQQVGNQKAGQGVADAGRDGSISGQADVDGNGNGIRDNALILNPQGKPFVTEFSAKRKLKAEKLQDTHEVAPAEGGGFVVQRRPAKMQDEFDQAAHEAATSPQNDMQEPTQAQKEAGNYAKGHVKLHGLDISIENPVGSTRSGTDANGKLWTQTMQHHYGYLRGSVGADKDHIDTFIGNSRDSGRVYVVDQANPDTGAFDEHKVMLGFDSLKEAKAAYKANYEKNWKGGKDVSETSVEGFKAWLKDGDTKKPFANSTPESTAKNSENIPFVRKGDFWNYSGDRAPAIAKALGTTVTQRDGVPMVGVPHHAMEQAAKSLRDAGIPASFGKPAKNGGAKKAPKVVESDAVKPASKQNQQVAADMGNPISKEQAQDQSFGKSEQLGKPHVERRKDSATRKKISEMTPDEMRVALLTDDMTQLGNRRAYEESDKKPFQASIDIDSLKWVNDNMGHASGDQLIRLIGRALKEQTEDAYHLSGDEFVAQFDDEAAGSKLLESVRDRLRDATIEITRPDGSVITKTGLEFSYGIAPTLDEADTKLAADKIAREASGQRAGRGEQPAGITERPAQGKPDNQGDAAADKEVDAKPKSKALQERDAKIAERSGKTSRLTPMAHEKLSDASTRADLETMAEESGWEQVGGKMLREIANDPNSRVIGRTPWIPKHEWYAAMPERLNEAQTQDAVKKALSGEPMTAKEKRVVGYMIDMADARNKEMTDYQAEHADDNDAQEAESALDALSDDQFDAIFEAGSTDPEEIMRALGFTEEEIANELPKAAGTESGQGTGETAAGTASESGQRSGAEAGPDGFALESETADQARTRIAAEERRQAEEKAAAKADDDKAKADAQVGGFALTGSDRAADANPGQGDIFSQTEKPKALQERDAKIKAKQEPRVIDEESYLAENGASRQDIGDAGLHRSSNKISQKVWSKKVNAQAAKDMALIDRREELRAEYRGKVAAGELRAPTRQEDLERNAQGDPDNESTQAARRLLEKRAARKEAKPSADDEMLPNVGAAGKTDSAAFKKWFGDSKVVNSDGKPLVVYHGTPSSVDQFEGAAQYFTEDPRYASAYASGEGGNVVPAYLSITKPLEISGEEYWNAINSKTEAKLIDKAKKDGHDGIIVRGFQDHLGPADMFITFEPGQIKSSTGNSGAFDSANPSILGNVGEQSKINDFDKSLYADIGAGKSSTDLLKSIAKESTNPMHRELAQALMDAGVKSTIEQGSASGQTFVVKDLPAGVTYTAGYDPKADKVLIFQAHDAEKNTLHELIHAATYKAVRAGGLNATQMKALFHHVDRSGQMGKMYGMENHDEFVAEALSNPEFQAKLRAIKSMPEGSKFANAWNWFTDVVRRAIGLPTKYASALDQALRFGRGMMDENNAQNADTNGGMMAGINPDTAAFKKWFGDSKVVDKQGQPLTAYHGTDAEFDTFDQEMQSGGALGQGFYFAEDRSLAASAGDNVMRVFLNIRNPLVLSKLTSEERAEWSELFESDPYAAQERAIDEGYDGILDDFYTDRNWVAFNPEQIKSATSNNGDFDPANPNIMAAAGSQRDAMRFVDQWETDDGKPIYYGKDWLLQPEKEMDTSADLQPNGLPMGQVAFVDDGNKVISYTIRDNNGKVLGNALLQVNKHGDIVAIHDIETKIKGSGLGTQVVGTILASNKNPVRIIQMIPSAENFWNGVGVYGKDTYDNGAIDWSGFAQSVRGRAAGMAQKGVQGRGAGTATGSESQSAEGGKSGLNGELLANVGRAADSFLGKLGVQENIRNNVSDLFQSEKTFNNWWHKSVGTQYHKAQIDHHFKRVYDATQRYLSTVSSIANEAADKAPTLLPKLDGLRDLFKKPPSTVDTQAAGRAIFEGTLNDQKVYSDAELKSKYNLTQPQIKLYREFRAATDKSLDDIGKTDILRYAGDDGAHLVNSVMAAKDVADGAKILTEHLNAIREEDAANVIQAKADRITQLKAEGYAPLMRFGEHTVYVTDKNGNQVFFGMAETGREAAKLARDMKETYPDATVTQGVLSTEGAKLFAGISPDTIEVFAKTTGLDKNPLFQDYLKLVINNRSALKRLIERKGIAGFSQDTTRVLASFLTSNARASSKNLHGGEMSKAANDIPKEKGDVRDEAIRLVDYIQNPVEEAAKLRGLLFTNFIGGSIASAAVNMTQPVMMTLPYLAQYGGAAKATKNLASAMKMAAIGNNSIQDKELSEAMHKAEREGIVSPQEIHNLQAEAMRSGKGITIGGKEIMPAFRTRQLALVWGGLFGLAEQFNRRTTFIAAYQTAKEMTPSQLEKAGVSNAYEFAAKSIAETQGVYNRGNRPDWARGALGATLMTFKQYSISYLEFLKRLPPKQRALALGILIVAAGANGLPFADDLDDVIDTIGQALGYNFNSKKAKQKFATSILGENGANFVLHGFSGVGGLPLDVSMRMGMGNLLPGTGLLKKSETDKTQQMSEFFGAAGGYGQKVLKAGDKLLSGDPAGALMSMASTATSNAAKAVDMMQNDAYRDSRGRKVMETDMVDAIVKGIGFQPSNVAQEQQKLSSVRQDIAMANAVKTEIADKWAEAVFEKDPQAAAKAREAINKWNDKNPESRINVTMDQIVKRVRAMRTEKQDRMIKSAPKSMRTAVREELK